MENVVAVVDAAASRSERAERDIVGVIVPDEAGPAVIEGMKPLVRSSAVTVEDTPPAKTSEKGKESETQTTQETTSIPPTLSVNSPMPTHIEEPSSFPTSINGGSSPIIPTSGGDRPATTTSATPDPRKRVVIAGLGMVAVAFIEKLLKLDDRRNEYSLLVLGEEPHIAYNRVGLTSYFEHREVEKLYLNPQSWYDDQFNLGKLNYMLSTTVAGIDPVGKTVTVHSSINVPATPIVTKYPVAVSTGVQPPVVNIIPYDILVLATGSSATAPTSTSGHTAPGVFLYRALGDLDGLITYSSQQHIKGGTGAVVGGGLLGLEAAKAMLDLANFGKVVIFDKNKWVLSRQLDEDAGRLVGEKIRELGVDLMSEKRVKVIKTGKSDMDPEEGSDRVVGVEFEDGGEMDIGCICYAIGIKPRDELARAAGLTCSERGGILINDELQTSHPDIYAIGECASWKKETYGLIAPGVEMADVLAFNLTQAKSHATRTFKRPDLSTKLKLLGVDVASFGDYFADRDGPSAVMAPRRGAANTGGAKPQVKALTYKDPFAGVYKKYLFTADGKKLLGGMMIGDTREYIKLVAMIKNKKELDIPPGEFILGSKKGGDGDDDANDLDDDTQICSCHNVTKGDIVQVVKDGSCKSIGEVKACTKAGTGCAGCMPLVQGIFNCEMKRLGVEVSNHLCPHFAYSRIDLFNIISVKKYATLPEVMAAVGKTPDSLGCEVCKPALASIFASIHNHHVLSTPHAHLQDTNDKYLGNIQRNGTFSVVPRVAGGEITPDKLIVIGEVAKKYGLYCKVTGGQRIDMFGARKQDLIDIWTTLVAAGMESGHAYAKSLRTIKSCVGTTWCRFGVGDSVGLAIRLENRYKSVRSPHKLKSAVSGCIRECAEAQNKDFGLIATDKGYNIFVGGNGGSKPRHGDLLIKDCPPDEVIPVLDRYLMFYIRTADKLQRTARWLEALPGGVKYIREVILEDKLGIAKDLEEQMSILVSTYFCEWAEVVNDPKKHERFRQFANIDPKSESASAPTTHDNTKTTPQAPPASDEKASEGDRVIPPVDLADNGIEIIRERGQLRPAYWPSNNSSTSVFDFRSLTFSGPMVWEPIIHSSKLETTSTAPTASVAVKRGDTQLAIFHVRGRGYFATQQMCPHKRAFVLSDGLIGDDPAKPGQLWVSCPQHKRNFELSPPRDTSTTIDSTCATTQATPGGCLSDPSMSIKLFKVERRDDEMLYIELPPVEELDAVLGTKRWIVKAGEAEGQFRALDEKLEKEREVRKRELLGRKGVKVGEGGGRLSPPGKKEGAMVGGGCGGAGVDW